MKKSCQTISNRKIFFKLTYYQQNTMLRLSYKNLNKRYDYCLITQFFISRCYVFKRWSFFDLKGFRGLSFPLPSPYLPLIFPLSSPYLLLIFPYPSLNLRWRFGKVGKLHGQGVRIGRFAKKQKNLLKNLHTQ